MTERTLTPRIVYLVWACGHFLLSEVCAPLKRGEKIRLTGDCPRCQTVLPLMSMLEIRHRRLVFRKKWQEIGCD